MNFELEPLEKTTMQIKRSELDYNPHIENYIVTHEQTKILYMTLLICFFVLIAISAGM